MSYGGVSIACRATSIINRGPQGSFLTALGTSKQNRDRYQRLHFGQRGDVPLHGDWDGSAYSEIGVLRPSSLTWCLDANLDGHPEVEFRYSGMKPGAIPPVDDWDGHGESAPGYFHPIDATTWHLRNSFSEASEDSAVIQFGLSTDMPIVGDWNGDGRDSSSIYRAATGEVTYSPAWPRTPRYPTLAANPIPNQWWRIGPGTDATRSPSYAARAGTVDLRTAPARRAFLPRSFSLARRARSPLGGRWKAPKATAQGSAAPQFVGLLAGSMSEGKRSWPRCVKSISRRVVATESTWLFLATFRCGFAVGGLTAEGSIHRQTKSLTG